MPPLDTGPVTHLRLVDPATRGLGPAVEDYDTLGAYLRAVREGRGLSLSDLAATTRVRRVYLQAIEDRNRSGLPSRPFAIGYVRSYAKALGLDGESAVQRFKVDWPETDEPLRNPVGVEGAEQARNPALMVALGVLLAGFAVWNVVQRLLINDEPQAPALTAALSAPPTPPPAGAAFRAMPPSEAPVESTTPAPYVTPGLFPGSEPAAPAAPGKASVMPSLALGLSPPSPVFASKLAVVGAPSGSVVLQARRSVAVIVRNGAREIVFARVLQPSEGFRPPIGRGLSAEVADPTSVAVYQNGRLHGLLTQMQTPVDALAPATAAPPAAPAASPAG